MILFSAHRDPGSSADKNEYVPSQKDVRRGSLTRDWRRGPGYQSSDMTNQKPEPRTRDHPPDGNGKFITVLTDSLLN